MSETEQQPDVAPAPAAPAETPRQLRIHEKVASRKARQEKAKKPPEADISRATSEMPSLRSLDVDIEAELQAAMEGVQADEMLKPSAAAAAKAEGPTGGRKVGRVVAIHGDDVFVESPGSRAQGVMPLSQFGEEPPQIGDTVTFSIERYDTSEGLLIFTKAGAVAEADWSTVAVGQIVEARVIEDNRGGLAVDVNGIRGFMPISQIEMFRVEKLDVYKTQKLVCMVVEVDQQAKNLVVSRRAHLEKEREESAKKLWEELAEGQVRKGFVRLVKPFGAFVDMGGVDGLIPVSEMSWKRIKDPSEVLSAGDNVEVVILRLDREAKKVTLSLRQMQTSPWDTIHHNYPENTIAAGTVTRLAEFGAFVELEEGLEGLIHISELSSNRVRRPDDVVKVGDQVQVRVLKIDRDAQRMSLSMKAVKEAEKVEEPSAAPAEPEPATPTKAVRRPTNLKGGLGGGGPLIPPLGSKPG